MKLGGVGYLKRGGVRREGAATRVAKCKATREGRGSEVGDEGDVPALGLCSRRPTACRRLLGTRREEAGISRVMNGSDGSPTLLEPMVGGGEPDERLLRAHGISLLTHSHCCNHSRNFLRVSAIIVCS